MRRACVRTTAGKVSATSEMPAASATSVLCQGKRSLQAGAGKHPGCNQHKFSEDRTAKDKARHMGTLLAASKVEAARFARIRYTPV
jgi:hypothetical protein